MSCKTIFVGSGKGGVGKSTVAVNLSIALAKLGLSCGLLDADVYGPSIPIMMGLRSLSPQVRENRVIPFYKFGLKVMSIGFFIEEARSVVWRGPVVHTALQKMVQEVDWGTLDVLIVDLPPGTGDAPLSLAKLLPVDGAIVVTTPQEVAILDAIKAINSFDQLDIPLYGIVENMAGFTPPGSQETFHLFGQGKAKELAERFQVPLLGSIPIMQQIREGSDEGYPSAFHHGRDHAGRFFEEISLNLLSQLKHSL